MHVQLTRLPHPTQDDRPTEVVERKGRGHPDTLCDVTAEAFSIALKQHYMDRFGEPLHHTQRRRRLPWLIIGSQPATR